MTTLTIDGLEYHLSDYNNSYTATVVKSDPQLKGRVEILSVIPHEGHDYIVTEIDRECFKESKIETLVLPTQLAAIYHDYDFFKTSFSLEAFEISDDAPHFTTREGVLYVRQKNAPQKLWLAYIPSNKKGSMTLESDIVGVIDRTGGGDISELTLSVSEYLDLKFVLHFLQLQKIKLMNCNSRYSNIGELIVGDNNTALFYPRDITGTYELPKCIEKIGNGCFALTQLSEIKLTDNVKEIGSFAFFRSEISSIIIPSSIKSLGYYTMSNCSQLETVMFPNNIKCIPSGTFQGCSSLTHLEIPGSVVKIEEKAFDFLVAGDATVTIHNAKENVELINPTTTSSTKIEWIYTETKEQQEQQWRDEVTKATMSGNISEEDRKALYLLGEHMRKQKNDMDFDIDNALYQINKMKKRKIVLAVLGAIIVGIILLIVL